jgi:hypothetical protein
MSTDHSPSTACLVAALTAPGTLRPRWCPGPDVDALLEQAEGEGLRPLIARSLLALPEAALDGALREALTERALREAAQELHRQRELARVVGALARAGVPGVLFKGAATALTLFERGELRPRDDADLLIDPRHLAIAGELLADLGYEAVAGNIHEHVMSQRLFRRRDPYRVLHNLDLHWRVSNRPPRGDPALDGLSPRALRARAVPLPALGHGALQPDALDQIIIACTHLSAHHAGAVRLIWLYEIHLMLARSNDAARAALARRVQELGVERDVAAGLAAALGVFDTPVRELESLLAGAVDITRPRPRLRHWIEDLARIDGNGQRLRYLAAHALPDPTFLRARPGAAHRPLALLYLDRAVRGLPHLLRR